jgi:hypothetical protein
VGPAGEESHGEGKRATVRRYRTDDPHVCVFSSEELHTILTKAPADLALMIRVTVECLPRLSEVLGPRREHIGPNWIEIRRKGGKIARVNILPERLDNAPHAGEVRSRAR